MSAKNGAAVSIASRCADSLQLQPVAEDHEPVDALERLQQRRAQVGAAQQVAVLGLAEVQIGDHERAHRGH